MTRHLRLRALILRYAGFALLATMVNLWVQRLLLSVSPTATDFALALAAGTLAGLVVKYLLDKRWIFYDRDPAHGRKFALYAVMGLATTAIFWGSEILFWLLWRTEFMREIGAIIGLGLGYVVKYRLDLRYVFGGAP